MSDKKYQIIYADPPWRFSSRQLQKAKGTRFHSLEEQYLSMTPKQILSLDVKSMTAEDAALFLWTTDAHLLLALEVITAWGFKYSTVAFVWVKKNKSGKPRTTVSPWTIKSCELCLFGTKGRMLQHKKSNNVRQLIEATVTRHSSKPYETRDRIERLFGDAPRLELFARFKGPGWDVWGNEIKSDIEIKINAN